MTNRVAVIFPGQGSQCPGMAVDVAASSPPARECFERASAVLGYDLLTRVANAGENELRDTRLSQPAIFTANVALYRAAESLGLVPVVSAGHSFGEYCSLTIAGALGFEDAVRLVNERAMAMGEAADEAPGSMAAVIGLEEEAVDRLCRQVREQTGLRVDIGNLNTPTQIVVSGDSLAVHAVYEAAKEAGAKRVRVLNVSGAWHSPLMASATERFAAAVARTELQLPAWTVISNVTGRPYRSTAEIRKCLVASLCARVRWHEAAVALVGYDVDLIVECGASEVLTPMMKRLPQAAGRRVAHVGDAEDLARLQATLTRESV